MLCHCDCPLQHAFIKLFSIHGISTTFNLLGAFAKILSFMSVRISLNKGCSHGITSTSIIFTFNYKTTQSIGYIDHAVLSVFPKVLIKLHLVSKSKYPGKEDNSLWAQLIYRTVSYTLFSLLFTLDCNNKLLLHPLVFL